MVPIEKVKDIINKHNTLEKELSASSVDPKLFAKKSKEISFHPRDDLIKPDLGAFLSLTDEDFRKKFSKSSIKRIGRDRFLRNVLIAVGNSKEKKYKKDIEALLEDESSTVRAMAVWSLKQVIDSNHIENYKKKYFALEKNKNVQEEWLN